MQEENVSHKNVSHENIFQEHKPLLFSIAYDMLGSVMDAEDCVQEAFLRWHQANNSGEAQTIRSPKSYLSTIVMRLCIDQLRSARAQRERYIGVWLPEPLVTTDKDSVADMIELSEALSVAFLRLLEHLSPLERAVFLLRQVFDYEYAEIAAIVQKSEDNCRQIVRRARQHLGTDRILYPASREQQDHILQQFILACQNGDMNGLLALLTDDIVGYSDGGGKARAALNPIYGPDKVARFLLGITQKFLGGLEHRLANVNGRPGIVSYAYGVPAYVSTLDIDAGRIREIDIIANPDKLRDIPTLH
jgi:RNA polymerase sigma-70 factor, ECF subfamily